MTPLDAHHPHGASGYDSLRASLVEAVRSTLASHGYFTGLADAAGDALGKIITDATGERPCTVCLAIKPLADFYLAAGKPDSWCKPCRKEKAATWRKESGWQRSPESRARDKALARVRAKANPERAVESTRAWRKAHPEQAKRQHLIAAQLRRNPELRASIIARDGCCLRCGALADLVIDHILPVLQGGDNDPSNLQTLCRVCNSKKRGAVDYRRKDTA